MAWKFPIRRVRNGDVIDIDDFNRNLRQFAEEEGHLNEHNFDGSAIQAALGASDIDDDIAWKVGNVAVEAMAHDVAGNYSGVDYAVVQASDTWVGLVGDQSGDSLELLFYSEGAPHMFIFTADTHWDDRAAAGSESSGALFAIAVDGAVVPESVAGDQDYEHAGEYMERGVADDSYAVECRCIVYLSPGLHIIKALGRAYTLNPDSGNFARLVFSRELIGWELGR